MAANEQRVAAINSFALAKLKPTATARGHLAVDLGACAPDLTQIRPLNVSRAGICLVDRKFGRHTDWSAQAFF
jgi:hypothetical protein